MDGLNSLVVAKATGPDGLSARILKLAAPMIAGSLSALFNVCLTEGVFPDGWKLADVYPVFKSGDSRLSHQLQADFCTFNFSQGD